MEAMRRSLAPEQEHLMHFLQERFQSIAEAAAFLGGAEGLEANLDADGFAAQLKRSGYLRPAEPLFRLLSAGRDRIQVLDILQYVSLPEEPMPQEESAFGGSSRSRTAPQLPSAIRSHGSSLRLQATPGTSRSLEHTLPAAGIADLERELASMRAEMSSLHERAARATAVQAESSSRAKAEEAVLEEAATLRAESAELRVSLSEALRLLAEERRERMNDRAEAARRHKDLETWTEDRLRSVETLANESREGTAEIKASVHEALQMGDLAESPPASRSFQSEQKIREALVAELDSRFRKMLSDERASRFEDNAVMQEHLGRVEETLATERSAQAKKMESINAQLVKVSKDLENEKDTLQDQLRELLTRQHSLRSSMVDGTREIREIEDDQTRHVNQLETAVTALTQRMDQEISSMQQGLQEMRQQLQVESLSREDSCNHLRNRLDGEARGRAEVAGTEISVKELKTRIDHLYQVCDTRDRTTTQKLSELLSAIDAEVKERAAADEQVLRKQGSAKEALPALIAAERQRTDAALAKLEEVLRHEDVAERQQRTQALAGLELRWQQLREATEDALKHRLEQHSSVALDVTKVSEALQEETRMRQLEQKVLANDLQRLGQEVAEAAAARRSVEEGLREQLAQTLKRLDQAKESQHKQDASVVASLEELRRSVTSEAAARELHFGQLQKDFQNDVLVKEELLSAANKGIQRAATKVAEDVRVALRDETRDREELRGRLEQHVVDVREAFGEMKTLSDKREADMSDQVRKAAEALNEDVRSRKDRDQQVYQAFEELRRELTNESSERRGAADGLIGRLQHIEATIAEEAASREELGRRVGRDLVQSQARLQEEKVLREESLAKLEQAVSVQATAPLQKSLQAEKVAREEEARSVAGKFQSIVAEQQMEREERSRLLRDVNVSLAKLQRMQAEEEDTRNQEHERLGGALESLQEVVRGLRQSGEETRQRSQEVADHLRSLISRESTARLQKFEAVDTVVREVRSMVTSEAQQREAAVRGLNAEINALAQAREDASGRERRAMEEEVGRAIREHRKSREEDERKVQERLIELQSQLSEEREQRLEALRAERLRADELKEELVGQRKTLQRELEKLSAISKRTEDLGSHLSKEAEARLQGLAKSCDDLRLELASDMQRSGTFWRQLEGKVTELESAVRTEVRDRKELQAELKRTLDAEVLAREEGLATEKRSREASNAQLDELLKVSLLEERTQRGLCIEDCRKDLAAVKGRLAEEGARRDHDTAERQFEIQKLETTLADIHRERSADVSRLRDTLEHVRGEFLEGSKALKEEVHKLDARCLADRATAEGIGRIAREQAMGLEAAIQGVHEDVTREADERNEAFRRLESRIADERRQLDTTAATQLRSIEDRLRQAEENARHRLLEDSRLPGTKAAANLSKAVADLDARCEAVRVTVGAVQSGLAEVQQKQTKTSEVEASVAQAREELRKETQERKAEGSQLSTRLVEHAERLELAEQQRVKASNELLQEVMEARSALRQEIRDREEGQSKVTHQFREEAAKREEALEREARLRLEGEERAAQGLQAAIREERRLRLQSEMRLEGLGKALAASPSSGDDRLAAAIMDSSTEEQTRLKNQLTELQARVASSEARQKTAEERTVSMLDAIMNGLMSNEA